MCGRELPNSRSFIFAEHLLFKIPVLIRFRLLTKLFRNSIFAVVSVERRHDKMFGQASTATYISPALLGYQS